MRINAYSRLASDVEVIDLKTGKVLEDVFYADDKRNEYGTYTFDDNGEMLFALYEPLITVHLADIEIRVKEVLNDNTRRKDNE